MAAAGASVVSIQPYARAGEDGDLASRTDENVSVTGVQHKVAGKHARNDAGSGMH